MLQPAPTPHTQPTTAVDKGRHRGPSPPAMAGPKKIWVKIEGLSDTDTLKMSKIT